MSRLAEKKQDLATRRWQVHGARRRGTSESLHACSVRQRAPISRRSPSTKSRTPLEISERTCTCQPSVVSSRLRSP